MTTLLLAVLALKDIFAPVVVGVPPADAVRHMCRLDNGEIRHYGKALVDGKVQRVYLASRDEGLSWKTYPADPRDPGALVKSPWSGEWIGFIEAPELVLIRSKIGPGDVAPERKQVDGKGHELRQLIPLKSRKRWIAAFSNITFKPRKPSGSTCYHVDVLYSDDDGRTWTTVQMPSVPGVARRAPGDRFAHWFNDGCEPTVTELKDGTLLLLVRTSGPHVARCRSTDGGATWSDWELDSAFWQANTMPYYFRLSDGRLLFIWNNTEMLPRRDPKEFPELNSHELSGAGEAVFTNRDALHAAISDDDGKTWKGFREIALNEIRNASDFRELGNYPDQGLDKSIHQTQALELSGGKVLISYGQNVKSRRLAIFDPDWLLETTREEDFRRGLGAISNHLYVKSLTGNTRGWAGHCAWNRMSGATLVRDPETDNPPAGAPRSSRELLQLCRICDPRLISDRQGVVWNFPAARSGKVTIDCRIVGSGFRLTLADHWMNPCDEVGPARSPLSVPITADQLPRGLWHQLVVAWDCASGTATLSCDGKVFATERLREGSRFGLSYLHLQTLAESADAEGTYFRRFAKE